MERWSDGAMERWSDGAMVRWSDGAMDGAMERWSDGAMERSCDGAITQLAHLKRVYQCQLSKPRLVSQIDSCCHKHGRQTRSPQTPLS